MFHTDSAALRLHYARLFLWDGPALEEGLRRAGGAARESAGARPGIRHGRLFPSGRAAIPRRPGRGRRPDRAHAATRPGARRRSRGLRRRGIASLPRRVFRWRFHRLRAAQFSKPAGGGARDRAGHPSRRAAGEPGLFPARQPLAAAAVSRLPLRAGRLLGPVAARAAASLHLYPRFAQNLRVHRRVFLSAAPRGIPSAWIRAVSFWAESACIGRRRNHHREATI